MRYSYNLNGDQQVGFVKYCSFVLLPRHTGVHSTSGELFALLLSPSGQTVKCVFSPTKTRSCDCSAGALFAVSYWVGATSQVLTPEQGHADIDKASIVVGLNGSDFSKRSWADKESHAILTFSTNDRNTAVSCRTYYEKGYPYLHSWWVYGTTDFVVHRIAGWITVLTQMLSWLSRLAAFETLRLEESTNSSCQLGETTHKKSKAEMISI